MAFAEASRASEAFDQIDTFKPDLILLDMELPDGNGLDICQRLRANGFQNQLSCLRAKWMKKILSRALIKERVIVLLNPCVSVNYFRWSAHNCANIKHQMT